MPELFCCFTNGGLPMYLRTVLIILVLGLLAIFAIFNWSAFSSPTTLTVGFATVDAPLGLILLAMVGVVTVLFLVYVVFLQSTTLMDTRRQARELQAQREIADRAEASRFEQLRSAMEGELKQLQSQTAESKAVTLARLDDLERDLRVTVEQSSNTLAAYIGEIEDRLERGHGEKR
jgi:uncharacterized integral membrane protein